MTVEAFAPAKINLTLHVTGRRADGFHLLDSLVAFATIGDVVSVAPADALSLAITGPEAGAVPADASNLALRAAQWLGTPPVALKLHKLLPPASGIGGGSSDAAAAIRAICALWQLQLPDPVATLPLGADVPACLAAKPVRMRGVGERLSKVPEIPPQDLLLVNPRVPVPTAAVFAAFAGKTGPPMADELPNWSDQAAFCDWLGDQRNDLMPPALAIAPQIGRALEMISDTGCLFAGMSGSGATCFGLYPFGSGHAHAARAQISSRQPGWWCAHGALS